MGSLEELLRFPRRAHSPACRSIVVMKLKTIVAIIAAVLGLGASAGAYSLASAPAKSDVAPAAATSQQDKAALPEVKVPKIVPATRFEWAPCKPPAVQKGDDCVTEVVQTIVLPSTGSGSSSGGSHESTGGQSGGGGGGGSTGGSDDGAGDDDSDDGDDHEDEDDEDDEDEPEDD